MTVTGVHPSTPPPASQSIGIPGYTIHRLLGQGGMATVYLATQEKLKRQVALKVILPEHARDPGFRERFISEGQLTARLFHRHVMTVFDIGEADGAFFLATELLPGGTLAERLPQIPSVVDKLLIVREVAEGLGFAHANKVIHRDIKPGNILFRADGTAVVADFGIAKAQDVSRAQTMQGMIVGTPSYMSPEQVQGEPLDGRSDLYSLGIMLYEMLVGELPFVATDLFAVAMAQIARPPPPLPEHLKPLQPLLDGMLEKLPARRVASAEALVAQIDALLPTLDDAALSNGATSRRGARPKTTRASTVSAAAPGASTGVSRRMPWLVGGSICALAIAAIALWPGPESPSGGPVAADPGGPGAEPVDAWQALQQQFRDRLAQRHYFAPARRSAHDTLRLMLAERATDPQTLALATQLIDAVTRDVRALVEAGDRTQASLLLSDAQAAFPNDAQLAELAEGLLGGGSLPAPSTAGPDGADPDELRRRAAAALSAGRVSTPPGDNAVEHYRRLLVLVPDDADAAATLRRIAEGYAAEAEDWLRRGDPEQAYRAVLRGLEARPDDAALLALRARARPAG